jgi:hypothetical protein
MEWNNIDFNVFLKIFLNQIIRFNHIHTLVFRTENADIDEEIDINDYLKNELNEYKKEYINYKNDVRFGLADFKKINGKWIYIDEVDLLFKEKYLGLVFDDDFFWNGKSEDNRELKHINKIRVINFLVYIFLREFNYIENLKGDKFKFNFDLLIECGYFDTETGKVNFNCLIYRLIEEYIFARFFYKNMIKMDKKY